MKRMVIIGLLVVASLVILHVYYYPHPDDQAGDIQKKIDEIRERVEKEEFQKWAKEIVRKRAEEEELQRIALKPGTKAYYLNNIRNPRIGMHINEFVSESINSDVLPIYPSHRYISSSGTWETWEYGPVSRPWKKFTFLNGKLHSVFEP